MVRLFLINLVLFFPCLSLAQSRDSTVRHSTVKSLDDAQYNAILNGDDIYNMAHVALLNHHPLPEQVLKYQKQLNLSSIQIGQLNGILQTLKLKKTEVGISVIRNEHMLDSMFRTRRLNEGAIIFYANRYGAYQGEYRGALLTACYNTRKLLTAIQLNKFYELQSHN